MEWLNYHHLYYFWTVAKEGSFTGAAKRLLVAQSAVSLQVSHLEEFLGHKLIVRSKSRKLSLTEEGHLAFSEAEEIFRQGNDLVQYFRSGKMKASFRVGALGGLSKNLQLKLLGTVIKDPSIELSLEVGDSQILLQRLIKYQLDAVLSDVPFPSSEAEPLTQVEIVSEPIILVSRKPSRRGPAQSLLDLKNGIYLPAKSSPLTSSILEHLNSEKIPFIARGFVDDIAFLRLLALETEAVIAIPKIGVRRELEAKELFIVHEFKKIRQNYFLIHRQKGKRHPMLTKLIKS